MSLPSKSRFEIMVLCAWSLLASLALAAVSQLALSSSTPYKYEHDQLGAVASENSICSNIGIDLLKAGGNAADAHVGTVFCVGVIGSYHSGLGGGGFMLIRSSSGSYESVDFRETAPAAAFENMYKDNINGSVIGGLASGVPGEVRGLEYLHIHYGVLPWKTILQPAIRLARHGFPIQEDLFSAMERGTEAYGFDFLTQDHTWAIDFAPNGTRLGLGDIMTRKRYANTLEMIAEKGPDVFYTGAMAKAMITAVQGANGTMTLADLQNYTVTSSPSLQIDYRGYRVHSCGAPASGAVVLSTLKTVEGYEDFGREDMLNLSTHRLDEAIRFGYGQRASLGDPAFVESLATYEAEMIKSTTAAINRGKISDKHTLNVSAYDPAGFESLETHGTSHVVTADASGLAITLTTTVNLFFGSTVMIPETGVIMNNEMNDFSIPNIRNKFGYIPSPSNYIRPHARPLSSITPTIVEHANGSLYYILGAAGGSRIITATIQNLWHVLDRNMSCLEALAQPRLHDQLIPNEVAFEHDYDEGVIEFMRGRGHNVTWMPVMSSAQAVRRLGNGTFEAAGEPRQRNSGGFAV
ncbi:hypothetical protein MMC08_005967 [Hypocenomyce scalaris]|nr:hypothetical protein [Hypocenomyce scalaris]